MSDKMTIEIQLTQGKFAVIDNDMEHLKNYKWFYADGYARRDYNNKSSKRISVFLHHCIIGRPLRGLEVDHINGNRLDCRKENLRFVTLRENLHNKDCHRGEKPMYSKYVGVSLVKGKYWVSQTTYNGKHFHIGTFNSEEKAHIAHISFCRAYESRDAEVNLLKSEVEELKKELQKIVDLSDIVVCHPCFTVGTRAYSRLPKGLYPRIHDLNDALQKYVLEESK